MSQGEGGGRPWGPDGSLCLYPDPAGFKAVCDGYFAQCVADEKVPTVNGLCLALGMTRETLLRYREKPDFEEVVGLVRTRLEAEWEQRLAGNNVAGAIFWLKNQGWSDKTETELYGRGGGPVQSVQRIERVIIDPANPDT